MSRTKHNFNLAVGLLVFAGTIAAAGDKRVHLFPKLVAGQKLTYLISDNLERNLKTESRVVTPMIPGTAKSTLQAVLRAEVLEVQEQGGTALVKMRADFESLDAGARQPAKEAHPQPGDLQAQESKEQASKAKPIEFVVDPDGRVDHLKGVDALSPEEQQAVQGWVSRFALPWTFPKAGLQLGEKWRTERAESSPSPIAGLWWRQQASYVRQEPCPSQSIGDAGVPSAAPGPRVAGLCAVLLVTAALQQKSSPKDATPEDFKLHELKTTGTAKGTNETIFYISVKTGLVVRSTEEASQSMDVVVAKADGSNRVHYNLVASSHSEVQLVSEAPTTSP